MAKYNISFKKSVAKDLRSMPAVDVKRILSRIERLAQEPRGEGCIKLAGHDKYRVRQGLYRIIYQIRDNELIVNVVKIGHRSSIYKIT
ncbi:MAG TPA: type II toxin-antitoxin system mRNA interferase toxin, RelE/StbE family [Oceanospirillaceae bacterium]|nr:type II toxin-antitoxin system mRNA interferase toxin, RelE/StbE family [Oceanospirillaceae bacterium]